MKMYCSQKLDNKRINCMLANVHKKTIFFPNFHTYFIFLVLKRMTDNKKYKSYFDVVYPKGDFIFFRKAYFSSKNVNMVLVGNSRVLLQRRRPIPCRVKLLPFVIV